MSIQTREKETKDLVKKFLCEEYASRKRFSVQLQQTPYTLAIVLASEHYEFLRNKPEVAEMMFIALSLSVITLCLDALIHTYIAKTSSPFSLMWKYFQLVVGMIYSYAVYIFAKILLNVFIESRHSDTFATGRIISAFALFSILLAVVVTVQSPGSGEIDDDLSGRRKVGQKNKKGNKKDLG